MSQTLSLQVTSDLHALTTVLKWFEPTRHAFSQESDWEQCRIALAEGFTNAVRHAHRHLPKETPIDLEVHCTPRSLTLRIWDRGQPFDLEHYLHQLQPSSLEAESGRGLRLLEKISDDLRYARTSDQRNCLYITKQLQPSGAGACY